MSREKIFQITGRFSVQNAKHAWPWDDAAQRAAKIGTLGQQLKVKD